MTTKQSRTVYNLQGCGFPQCAPCYALGYEGREMAFVCGYLDRVVKAGKLNGVFVDVGAHVGLWSLAMSEWYQSRYKHTPNIYALECDPLNFKTLTLNAEQENTGITPLQLAAWSNSDWVGLKRDKNPGRHKVFPTLNISRKESIVDAFRVQGVALDALATTQNSRQMDVIKIDVEGAELNVLNGAREILNVNDQLLVMVEYSTDHFNEYGHTPKQMTAFMTVNGYRPVRPEDKATIKTIKAGELKRVMFVKGEVE